MEYVRLADGLHFTINKIMGFKYKMWDVGGKKWVVSDRWQEGFQKKWSLETDKGILELSNSQLSSCLVATFNVNTQTTEISGAKFQVKTNGKTGMEIRYFFSRIDSYSESEKPRQSYNSTFNVDEIPM